MNWYIDPPIWIQFLTAVLGAWRVGVLLVYERGPGDIFMRLRASIGIEHHPEDFTPTGYPENLLGSLFGCVWCMAFWTSLAMYVILWWSPHVVLFLGIWGGASIIEGFRSKM